MGSKLAYEFVKASPFKKDPYGFKNDHVRTSVCRSPILF
jgi:hypothetical protein